MLVLVLALGIATLGKYLNQKPSGSENRNLPPSSFTKKENVPAKKLLLAVYFPKITQNDIYLVREVHEVPYTSTPAKAALEELIHSKPLTKGAAKILPADTKIIGINISEGTAIIDFSREVLKANVGSELEAFGIQSIVNTLTEFPSIKEVSFKVEGKLDQQTMDWWGHVGLYEQPFKRDLSRVYEPAIWVTSPQPGQNVKSPLIIQGSAMVFEGTVQVQLLDPDKKLLAQGYTTATEGAPGRGDFSLSLEFTSPAAKSGRLEVFSVSPKDGSKENIVVIPVNF